jgi:hypothetical protein
MCNAVGTERLGALVGGDLEHGLHELLRVLFAEVASLVVFHSLERAAIVDSDDRCAETHCLRSESVVRGGAGGERPPAGRSQSVRWAACRGSLRRRAQSRRREGLSQTGSPHEELCSLLVVDGSSKDHAASVRQGGRGGGGGTDDWLMPLSSAYLVSS